MCMSVCICYHESRATLDVQVRVAPFAASSGDRRYMNPNTDRRLLEQANLIQQAMEASILMQLHPRSKIEISIVVLADDGGRLCVAINAATLALIDAGIAVRDFVCACSAGLMDDVALKLASIADPYFLLLIRTERILGNFCNPNSETIF